MHARPQESYLLCFCYVLILILQHSAFAQTATVAHKLYGAWYTYPLGNPDTDPVRHEFRHNAATDKDEMVVTHHCAGEHRPVVARAVSPIEVSEDTIRVLESATGSEPTQSKPCEASIAAGTLSYTLSEDENRLTITNPGGNPDLLELARQDSASEAVQPKRLYGTWLLPAANKKGSSMQTRIVFYATADHEKIRQVAICSKGNDTVVSHVDSDIDIGKDEIKVMQSASHTQQEGDFLCRSTLSAGTWHYSVAPGGITLTLSIEGGKPMTLTREGPSGLD